MALPNGIQDRELNKFVDTLDGPAVRVSIFGGGGGGGGGSDCCTISPQARHLAKEMVMKLLGDQVFDAVESEFDDPFETFIFSNGDDVVKQITIQYLNDTDFRINSVSGSTNNFFFLLKQDGFKLLQQNGSGMILGRIFKNRMLTQDGFQVLQQSGFKILV